LRHRAQDDGEQYDDGNRATNDHRDRRRRQDATDEHADAEGQEQYSHGELDEPLGKVLALGTPTTMASASAATMPGVEPIHTPTQSLSAARVTVASIVLSPSSASTNADITAKNAGAVVRWARAASSAERRSPRSVHNPNNKRHTGENADQVGGQRRAQVVADRDRDQVYRDGGGGDASEHHRPGIAQPKRHRHQLRLVAQFGDENDAEA
jgi:hypothetical protein